MQWEIAFSLPGVGLWTEHLPYTCSIESETKLSLELAILGKEGELEGIDADFQQ